MTDKTATTELSGHLAPLLARGSKDAAALKDALGLVLAHFKSETGTIHWFDAATQTLHLAADAGLPPPMREIVRTIPAGKGIAGQVVVRKGPVTICNLQTDTSGVAKPGARGTGVGGALCVPIWRGNALIGTLGVGTQREYEYTPEETRDLEQIGRQIGAIA